MTRITALDLPMVDPLPESTQRYFDICTEKLGMIPNVLQAYAFDITKLNAFTAMYNDLMLGESGLSKLEREMIAVVVSSINRCWYCQVAHGAAVRALGSPAARDHFTDRAAFDAWETRWQTRRSGQPAAAPLIRAANPAIIPRNHRVEQMIGAATDGDYTPFHRLAAALARPFDDPPEDLTRPPMPNEEIEATFCGT